MHHTVQFNFCSLISKMLKIFSSFSQIRKILKVDIYKYEQSKMLLFHLKFILSKCYLSKDIPQNNEQLELLEGILDIEKEGKPNKML